MADNVIEVEFGQPDSVGSLRETVEDQMGKIQWIDDEIRSIQTQVKRQDSWYAWQDRCNREQIRKLEASLLARYLFREEPTQSATVRVGLALRNLAAVGQVRRIERKSDHFAHRWEPCDA